MGLIRSRRFVASRLAALAVALPVVLPAALRPLGAGAQEDAGAYAPDYAPEYAPEATQAWVDPGPGRWQGGDREVVVSLGAQRMWAYEGDAAVLTTLVSTGTAETWETTTPIGQFTVLTKLWSETMEGVVNGVPYRVENVPHVMYFTNEGHAIHGTYWHSNFGTPMSHGCVNQPLDVAAWMYDWAPIGTAVTVIG